MIINLTLDKINIQKTAEPTINVEAKNNVKIIDIQKKPLSQLEEKQSTLNFKFQFSIKYEPNIGFIEISGAVVYLADEKTQSSIFDEWTKNKRIDPKISGPILNHILSRCNIKSLVLSQELGLPPHIPLPKVAIRSNIEKSQPAQKPQAS